MSESDKSLIEMVMRNTDYTEAQAQEKLVAHNNDITCVIREYLSGTPVESIVLDESKSTNQRVYQEIRQYLDENRIPRGQN